MGKFLLQLKLGWVNESAKIRIPFAVSLQCDFYLHVSSPSGRETEFTKIGWEKLGISIEHRIAFSPGPFGWNWFVPYADMAMAKHAGHYIHDSMYCSWRGGKSVATFHDFAKFKQLLTGEPLKIGTDFACLDDCSLSSWAIQRYKILQEINLYRMKTSPG